MTHEAQPTVFPSTELAKATAAVHSAAEAIATPPLLAHVPDEIFM